MRKSVVSDLNRTSSAFLSLLKNLWSKSGIPLTAHLYPRILHAFSMAFWASQLKPVTCTSPCPWSSPWGNKFTSPYMCNPILFEQELLLRTCLDNSQTLRLPGVKARANTHTWSNCHISMSVVQQTNKTQIMNISIKNWLGLCYWERFMEKSKVCYFIIL